MDFMVKHFSKPKSFPFPAYQAPRPSARQAIRWAPQLIIYVQIPSLYIQKPQQMLDRADRADLLFSDWVVHGLGGNVLRV